MIGDCLSCGRPWAEHEPSLYVESDCLHRHRALSMERRLASQRAQLELNERGRLIAAARRLIPLPPPARPELRSERRAREQIRDAEYWQERAAEIEERRQIAANKRRSRPDAPTLDRAIPSHHKRSPGAWLPRPASALLADLSLPDDDYLDSLADIPDIFVDFGWRADKRRAYAETGER